MKIKQLLLLFLAGFNMCANAQGIQTSDKVVVAFDPDECDPLVLNYQPTEDDEGCFFTVQLEGNDLIYCGYQMDIHLPIGMRVAVDEEGDNKIEMAPLAGITKNISTIYPYTSTKVSGIYVYTYSHKVSSEMISDNVLRVTCLSQESKNFTATTGDMFKVYVQTTPYMKPGDVEIKIDGVILTHNEWSEADGMNHAISYVPADPCGGVIEGVSGECNNVPFNVSSTNKWSTCILPFDVTLPASVTAYTCVRKEEDKVYLTPAESMEAYTPYVLYSENGYSGTLSGTVDASKYPDNGFVCKDGLLYGAIVPQQVTEGYVLQNLSEGVKFYQIKEGDTFVIPAGKCWLNLGENEAKSLAFEVVDPTGIEEIASDSTDSSVYTLDGKKVLKPQPNSIYIKSGKKFINK